MRLPTLAEFQEAAAFVHETLDPTPQIAWPLLAKRTGAQVWVKHENHTPIGAFKVRGGLVFMDDLRRHGAPPGVIAATRGNHGQSIAFSAARLGLASVLVVPEGNAAGKNAAMAAFGGELVIHGADFEDAFGHAEALAAGAGPRDGSLLRRAPDTGASAPTRWSSSPPCPISMPSTCRSASAPASAG